MSVLTNRPQIDKDLFFCPNHHNRKMQQLLEDGADINVFNEQFIECCFLFGKWNILDLIINSPDYDRDTLLRGLQLGVTVFLRHNNNPPEGFEDRVLQAKSILRDLTIDNILK